MQTDRRPMSGARTVALFVTAVVAGSLFMQPGPLEVRAAAPASPRGQPIKPLAAGTPAKPSTNAASETPLTAVAAATNSASFATVGFDTLATFKYEVPEDSSASSTNAPSAAVPDPDEQIPSTVKAFNGRRIALKGFMLPLKVEGGLVTELLLMRDQSMCCFGSVPKINEWVAVKMTSSGVKPIMDQAVTLFGTIKVGAMRENGYLVGIYQMDGERMDGPPGM